MSKEPLRLSTSTDVPEGASAAVYIENGEIVNVLNAYDPETQCFVLPVAKWLADHGKEAYIVVNPNDLDGVKFPDSLYTEDE